METISLKGMVSVAFLKKSRFSGTFHAMRYMLFMEEKKIKAVIYPGPYCWEATPEDQKKTAFFEGTSNGLKSAQDWLNDCYQNEYMG